MRILLTGHKCYIGAVAAPVVLAAGLDADLFASCDLRPASAAIPEVRADLRDLKRADLEGSTPWCISPHCPTILLNDLVASAFATGSVLIRSDGPHSRHYCGRSTGP